MSAQSAIRRIASAAARVLSTLLLVTMFAGVLAQPVEAAQPPPPLSPHSQPPRNPTLQFQPQDATPALQAVNCMTYHEVEKGQTLAQIAQQYGVSPEALVVTNQAALHGINPYTHLQGDFTICIPGGIIKAGGKWVCVTPQMTAIFYMGSRLSVFGYDFPKNHRYYVKVREHRTDTWVRVAVIQADKKGKINGDFHVPRSLRRAHSLYVCLKEVNYGYTVCTNVKRQ